MLGNKSIIGILRFVSDYKITANLNTLAVSFLQIFFNLGYVTTIALIYTLFYLTFFLNVNFFSSPFNNLKIFDLCNQTTKTPAKKARKTLSKVKLAKNVPATPQRFNT